MEGSWLLIVFLVLTIMVAAEASPRPFPLWGADVHLTTSITIQEVEHVIIHIHIYDCKTTGPDEVRSSKWHVRKQDKTDGDGVTVKTSNNIWIDHNSQSSCTDELLDVTRGSDSISITNNYFRKRNEVMLLGSHYDDWEDKSMRVIVAFNVFGHALCPTHAEIRYRCRLGTFQVFNNFYKSWELYAIWGSANATVSSEANHFEAGDRKSVTKHMDYSGNWCSVDDLSLNGAWFETVRAKSDDCLYSKSFSPLQASLVPKLTANAGPTS